MHQFKKKISRKSFVYAEYRDCKFVCYMREMNFCGRKSTKFKKNIVKNPI